MPAVLLEHCRGARPPTLPGSPLVDELTRRERGDRRALATGLSSREIADGLFGSVRSVDNRL